MRPIIGITCSFEETSGPVVRRRSYLNAAYTDAVYAAGGLPLPLALPPMPDEVVMRELLARCDGLIFSGGDDVDPARYGQAPHPRTGVMHARRDAFELDFFQRADESDRPILAICLGCQVTNVCRGGALVQHVDDLPGVGAIRHHMPDHSSAYHTVRVVGGSRLASIVGTDDFEVNSRHHQVVDAAQVGGRLRPVAFAPDGVVEAAEDAEGAFLLAVQWHPEDMIDRPQHFNLFKALVAEADRLRKSR